MLKQADKDKLKALGFDPDKLVEAAKADTEVDIVVPEGQILSTTDLEARDINTKAEGKREGVTEGKAAGLEIAGKSIAKKFNLPTTVDTKKLDTVLEAVNSTITGGDEALKQQITLLQKDKETLTQEKETLTKSASAAQLDSTIISWFPAGRDATLEDGERLMLVKNALQFETEDGKQVVKKNGEILRDPTTKNPLAPKDAVAQLFVERKWADAQSEAGRGGGNAGGGAGGGGTAGIKTFSAAQAQWKKDNPQGNAISPEATDYIANIAKDVTDFDWHS